MFTNIQTILKIKCILLARNRIHLFHLFIQVIQYEMCSIKAKGSREQIDNFIKKEKPATERETC